MRSFRAWLAAFLFASLGANSQSLEFHAPQPASTPAIVDGGAKQSANPHGAGVETNPNLTKRWLKGEGVRNKPTLVIGRSDADAILAGYQDRSGKRILFRAVRLPNGTILSEVLHLNAATGQAERLIDYSKDIDPSTGKRVRDFKVNGVHLFDQLKSKRNSPAGNGQGRQKVAEFADTDAGTAFLRGVAALYIALDDSQHADQLEALKLHFGVLAMMVQMAGDQSKGMPDAGEFASADKHQSLKSGCASEDCLVRGKSFVIHKSGFFDALSNPNKQKRKLPKRTTSPLLGKLVQGGSTGPEASQQTGDISECIAEEENEAVYCYGRCGYRCGTPDIRLDACYGHDWCVCRFGTAACAVATPAECNSEPRNCKGFAEAVIAVGEYLFVETFNLIEDFLEGVTNFVADVMISSFEIVSGLINGLIDAVTAFIDWILNDPNCMEESQEAC